MNQKFLIYLTALLFLMASFTSCEEEESDSPLDEQEEMAKAPSEGSSLSSEDQKETLETTGMDLNEEMTSTMKSEQMEASVSFAYFLSHMENDPLKRQQYQTLQRTKAFQIIQAVNKIDNSPGKIGKLPATLKKNAWEPESIEEVYDSLSGKFTWNPTSESWDYTESESIIFEFPATKNAGTNNASFIIENVADTTLDDYYYFGQGSWNEYPEDAYTGFIPTGLYFYLAVNDTKYMEYQYSASFNEEGFVKNLSVDFNLGLLSYAYSFSNKNSKTISTNTSLMIGEKKLIEFGAGINGDISRDNLENSIRYWAWDPETYRDTIISAEDTASYDEYWPEPDPKEILNKGFAYFTIMDKLKLGGKADIKDLIAAEEEIYPLNHWDDPNFDEDQATADWAAALNKHTDFFMANMEKNQWMAKARFYVKEESGYYDDYSYVALRLIFSDDSKVDPEVYFGEGFDDLIKDFNNSMKDVESTYSAYEF